MMEARQKPQTTWRISLCALAALGYPVVLYGVQALISALLSMRVPGASLANPAGVSATTAALLRLLAGLLALALPALFAAREGCLTRAELGLRPAPKGAFRRWLPLFLGTAAAADLLGGLLSGLLDLKPAAVALPTEGGALFVSFLSLCVLPAIGEEFFFRGVLQGLLRPAGAGAAMWGSAVLFALLHGGLPAVVTALAGGLVLAACVRDTGSILPGIGLHFINNGIAFAAVLLARYNGTAIYMILMLMLPFWGLFAFLRSPVHLKKSQQKGKNLLRTPAYLLAVVCLSILCLTRSF